jgi:hypothetical protein
MDARTVEVKMVDGSVVKGKINVLADEGMPVRVSDVFTKTENPFIVVFDATAEGQSGRVMVINKQNIAWVSPAD